MPEHRHLTRQLLLAARRGTLPARAFADHLLRRLTDACPHCRRVVESLEEEEIPLPAYRAPVARALHRIPVSPAFERYEEQTRHAPELFALLEPHSAPQRLLLIRNSPGRFANLALGERVLDAARACLPHDPTASLGWAETAAAIADAYLDPCPAHQVRAVSLQGNAYRALGDFERARQLLGQAREMLDAHHVYELDVAAELHSYLGSLYTDLAEWAIAAECLESAAAFYQALGDTTALARVYIKLGNLHGHNGDSGAAIQADRAACNLLDPKDDLPIYLIARLNYAFHLQELGEIERSLDVLDYELDLWDRADPHTSSRLSWLRARLALATGEPAEAERRYLELRDLFAAQEHAFHVALVSVELATLYLEQRRLAELEELAHQALTLFQANALHQDALATLRLLYEAARMRSLTVDALERAGNFLRQAERQARSRATN